VEVSLREEVDGAKWEDLLLHSPMRTVFQSLPWMETLASSFASFRKRFIVVSSGGRYLGGLPFVTVKRSFFPDACFSQPFGTYGGPVVRDDSPEQVAQLIGRRLDEFVRSRACASFQVFCFVESEAGLRRFAESVPSLRRSEGTTHIVRLDGGFEHLWSSEYESELRTAIRQAERKNVTVSERTDTGGARVLARLYLDQAARARWKGTYPAGLFENIVTRLPGEVKIWVAERSGVPQVAMLVFYFGSTVMPWVSGATRQSRNLRANILLLSRLIQDACERGYRIFNLGASGGNRRLERFKETYGARRFIYPVFRYEGPTWRVLRRVRRIMGRRNAT